MRLRQSVVFLFIGFFSVLCCLVFMFAREQSLALSKIRNLGVRVSVHFEGVPCLQKCTLVVPVDLSDEGFLMFKDELSSLSGVFCLNVDKPVEDDSIIDVIRSPDDVCNLSLAGAGIDDGSVVKLQRFSNLMNLNLYETRVSDASCPILTGGLKLRSLSVVGCNMSPVGFGRLKSWADANHKSLTTGP